MKKLISLVLVLVMVLSLSVTAFASDLGENKDVTAEYTPTATEPTKYTLTIQAAENGTVTAVPTEAAAGEKITLTVTPAEGYKLDTLAAGVEGDVAGAATVTGTLQISGTPNDTVTEAGIKVAEITVTIQ